MKRHAKQGFESLKACQKAGYPKGYSAFWHISMKVRDSNHVRTCRGHVHEPVRTLANTFISFRVSRKRKEMQANPLRRAKIRSAHPGAPYFAFCKAFRSPDLKTRSVFERSGWKLRSKPRSGELRRGLKADGRGRRLLNHVRKPRWGLYRPVQKPVDTFRDHPIVAALSAIRKKFIKLY